MPQPCTVCHHPSADEINAALIGGTPRLRIARRFGLKEPAVRFHAGHHLPEHVGLARRASEAAEAGRLLERVRRTAGRLEWLMGRAETEGDWRTMLSAASELRRWLELLAKLADGLGTRSGADAASTGPHELAREAARYLEWYRDRPEEAPGAYGRRPTAGVRRELEPDDLIEIDDPDDVLAGRPR